MITCKECGSEHAAANILALHLRKHSMSYLDYVVKHNYNGVHPTCPCGKQLILRPGGFYRFCSRSCAAKGSNNSMSGKKGENCPNFGKKRTPEQLANYSIGARKRWELHGDKLRKMMKSPEYKEAQSISQKEANKLNPEISKRKALTCKRFWSSDSEFIKQRRKEASDRAVKLIESNKIGSAKSYKREWIKNPFTNKDEYMHSSWESSFLRRCIKENCPVTKNHGIRIEYTQDNGTVHQYIPDFLLIDDKVLFEVKGILTPIDVLKFKAATAAGYEVIVVSNTDAYTFEVKNDSESL